MSHHLEQCRLFLRKREESRQERLDRRFDQACYEARAIIALIIDRYRPSRIYQWGSLLNRQLFWERSDMDIAVEGIGNPAEFFALYGEADQISSIPLDLVALEKIEPEFADLIRTKGRLVYERNCKSQNPPE
jgi:predicted nucleotidyltransferase